MFLNQYKVLKMKTRLDLESFRAQTVALDHYVLFAATLETYIFPYHKFDVRGAQAYIGYPDINGGHKPVEDHRTETQTNQSPTTYVTSHL